MSLSRKPQEPQARSSRPGAPGAGIARRASSGIPVLSDPFRVIEILSRDFFVGDAPRRGA